MGIPSNGLGNLVPNLIHILSKYNGECHSLSAKTSEVSKGAKVRNGYNQAPHLTQDTMGK